MMATNVDLDAQRRRAVTATLKGVRRLRRLGVAETAERMGMSLRSYQYFEAGSGALNFDRLSDFARATESDFFGLIMAIYFRMPDLAVSVADNRALFAFMVQLSEFSKRPEADIARLTVGKLFLRYSDLFNQLALDCAPRDAEVESWLSENLRRVIGDGNEDT